MAYERDFSHIPYDCPLVSYFSLTLFFRVLNLNRRPLGYVDVARLKQKWESCEAKPVRSQPLLIYTNFLLVLQDDKVSQYVIHFNRSSDHPYTTITPLTPLSDLEEFLKKNVFALGMSFYFPSLL